MLEGAEQNRAESSLADWSTSDINHAMSADEDLVPIPGTRQQRADNINID